MGALQLSRSGEGLGGDEIEALRRLHPTLFPAPWWTKRNSLWIVGLAALTAFGLWWIDADPMRLVNGLSRLGILIGLMLPPSSGGALADFSRALLETLAMAFLGTLLATVMAVPLALLGARNVMPGAMVRFGVRRVFDALRGVDTLIWALIFVNAVGLGPFAGILALAVSDTGTLAKIFAEAFENVDPRPVDGVRSAGAGRFGAVRLGLVPQVLPIIVSNALYFLESNTRSASILGLVGAGGIGLALADRMRINNWDEVAFILIMILVAVALVDAMSGFVRRRLVDVPS